MDITSFNDTQLEIIETVAQQVEWKRRPGFLQELARTVGRRGDDLGDGELHRLGVGSTRRGATKETSAGLR